MDCCDTSKNIFGQFLWTGFDFMGEAGRWPMRSSGAGLMDLAGFPKQIFMFGKPLGEKACDVLDRLEAK